MNLATHHLSAACYEIGRTIIFFLINIFIFSLFDFPFSFLVSNIFQHTHTDTHTHPHAPTRILAHKLTSRKDMWNSTTLPCPLLYYSICQSTLSCSTPATLSPPPLAWFVTLSSFLFFLSSISFYSTLSGRRIHLCECVFIFFPFLFILASISSNRRDYLHSTKKGTLQF